MSSEISIDSALFNEETDFQTDLGADSLDIVELIMAFEDEFDINVNDDAAGKIKTVKQVIDYIESNVE